MQDQVFLYTKFGLIRSHTDEIKAFFNIWRLQNQLPYFVRWHLFNVTGCYFYRISMYLHLRVTALRETLDSGCIQWPATLYSGTITGMYGHKCVQVSLWCLHFRTLVHVLWVCSLSTSWTVHASENLNSAISKFLCVSVYPCKQSFEWGFRNQPVHPYFL